MIKRKEEFQKEERTEMRGGTGTVKFERVWERGTEMKSPTRLFSKLILEPGDSIITRHGDNHSVACHGDETLVLLAAILPY